MGSGTEERTEGCARQTAIHVSNGCTNGNQAMKLRSESSEGIGARRRQHGSTTLVVLVLLLAMTALAATNSSTLFWLKRELTVLDQQQQKKFQPEKSARPKIEKRGT